MKCPKCNFEVADNTKFCPECGEKMLESTTKDTIEALEKTPDETNLDSKTLPKKSISKKRKIAIISIASVVIVAIVLLLVFVVFKHEHNFIYECTKEPTLTEEGVQHVYCEGCDQEQYFTIPRLTVTDLINSIEDAESCYKAAEAYFSLSESERFEVYNYMTLMRAMDFYASDTKIRDLQMKLKAKGLSDYFHDSIRNKLLNINSYTVNEQITVVFYDEDTENYYLYIKIDYSAQNKAGGYTRYKNNADYYVWENDRWATLPYSSDADIELVEKIYTWQFDEYDRYDFTYNPD